MKLMPHQLTAVEKLSNGKILWGGVGSGKSLVALAYYANKDQCGDIYVITTAKKRDSLEWMRDGAKLGIGSSVEDSKYGILTIDSWHNISKYTELKGHTFIFDEQKLVGNGVWVKSFYKIAKNNHWIILSATPGDTWMDYIPVFVANGFYKNKTEFIREHVVYKPFSRFPQVDRFVGEQKLERLKAEILVEMPYLKHTTRDIRDVEVNYDKELFDQVWKKRWHVYEDRPIENVSELFSVARKVVNSDPSRVNAIREIIKDHPKLIIFYNFNYELALLRELSDITTVAEWNGHKKMAIPDTKTWVYLVQYMSGSEGWNCTETDSMVFYSLTYSYKNFEQAQGRIDRLDTIYNLLTYFKLSSKSVVDRAVNRSLSNKKSFNERRFLESKF